jgi:hypothetical protein
MKKLEALNIKGLILVFTGVFTIVGCDSTNVNYDIPEPYVDETIYLSDPSSFNLTVIGGQIYLPNAGHGGIMIYRRYYDQAFYDFAAYELACPYDWADAAKDLSSPIFEIIILQPCV